jgi:hypothetical protein
MDHRTWGQERERQSADPGRERLLFYKGRDPKGVA